MPIQRLKYLFRRVNTYSHILNIYSTILNTYSPSRILTNVGGCAAGVRGSHPGRPLFVLARRAHLRALTQAPSRRAVSPVEGLSGAGHSSTHGRGSRARRGLGGASGRVLRVRAGSAVGWAVFGARTPVVVVFVTIRPRVLTTRAGERIARARVSLCYEHISLFIPLSLPYRGEREGNKKGIVSFRWDCNGSFPCVRACRGWVPRPGGAGRLRLRRRRPPGGPILFAFPTPRPTLGLRPGVGRAKRMVPCGGGSARAGLV